MRSKRKCAEEDGGGRESMRVNFHADQLMFQIIVVLGVEDFFGIFLYCFNFHRKLIWKLRENSWWMYRGPGTEYSR